MLNQNNPIHFNSRTPRVQVIQRKPRNYNHLKPVYQTMKWKDFALQGVRKNSIDNVQRLSAKNSIRGHNSPSYHHQTDPREYVNHIHNNPIVTSRLSQRNLREQNMRLSGTKYHPREQQLHRVKQQALHRVKLLQQKVLPLISHQHNNEQYRNNEQEYGLSWQLKMEQRLIKIQNNMQNIKNQMEIKMEKKLIEMEKIWEQRFSQLVEMYQDNHMNINQNNNHNMNNNYQLHNINNNSEQHELNTYYQTQSSNGLRHQYQQQQHSYNNNNNNQLHTNIINNNNNNNNNNQNYKYYKSGFNHDDNKQY